MITDIKTITLGGFSCNCYLVKTGKGFVLIDTGIKSKRTKLELDLAEAGCSPGKLDLIILTHGDFDHTGNCVYLREKYDTKIAMHHSDSGMVEHGDMFLNRNNSNWIIRKLVNVFFRITRFKPDFMIDEETDLSEYGLDAKVLHLPGHSKGSIGILRSNGEFFCGDVFTNTKRPELNSMADDLDMLNESVDRIKVLKIKIVYPGHGKPFKMDSLR